MVSFAKGLVEKKNDTTKDISVAELRSISDFLFFFKKKKKNTRIRIKIFGLERFVISFDFSDFAHTHPLVVSRKRSRVLTMGDYYLFTNVS